MEREVLIASARPWITIARLAGLLRRAGARVTIMTPEGSILRTRYAAASIPCSADPELLCAQIWEHLGRVRYARVLLGDERTLGAASSRPTPAFEGWPAWLARGDVSRAGWMSSLRDHGVSVVPFAVVVDAAAFRHAAVRWPALLKKNWSAGGHGVLRMAGPGDVDAARGAGFPCLLQEWCDGEVGTCEVVAAGGRVLAWYASFTRDPWPAPFGPSSTREVFHDEALQPLVEAVAAATGFDGPCGFDWIRGPTGYRVIEFNARPTTCYHLGALAGVDFARALGAWLEGRDDRQDPRPPRGGRAVVHVFPRYLVRAVARRDAKALWRCVPGVARHDVPWGDPMLAARQAARSVVDGWREGVNGARTGAARAG